MCQGIYGLSKLRAAFHKKYEGGNKFLVNYRTTAEMQQMGIGGSEMETMCEFVNFPSGASAKSYLKKQKPCWVL